MNVPCFADLTDDDLCDEIVPSGPPEPMPPHERGILGARRLREARERRTQQWSESDLLLNWLPGAVPRAIVEFRKKALIALRR